MYIHTYELIHTIIIIIIINLASCPKLVPIPGFLPPGYSSLSCFPRVSSTWENPEVGCGDNLLGSYLGARDCTTETSTIQETQKQRSEAHNKYWGQCVSHSCFIS